MVVDIPRDNTRCTIVTAGEKGPITQSMPAGPVYVAYTLRSTDNKGARYDVMFTRSADCGNTWTTPVRLNDKSRARQPGRRAGDRSAQRQRLHRLAPVRPQHQRQRHDALMVGEVHAGQQEVRRARASRASSPSRRRARAKASTPSTSSRRAASTRRSRPPSCRRSISPPPRTQISLPHQRLSVDGGRRDRARLHGVGRARLRSAEPGSGRSARRASLMATSTDGTDVDRPRRPSRRREPVSRATS